MIKGKSMVSEEIELNHACEAAGIGALESDMGEYIVQLAGEKPSHIIMPAIHKTKEEIAKLFAEKVPGVDYTDNVDALIQIGRRVLREKFLDRRHRPVRRQFRRRRNRHPVPGRERRQRPHVHHRAAGAYRHHRHRKSGRETGHVPPLLSLLTRSATGQNISTYFNMISGPRQPGEKDGPKKCTWCCSTTAAARPTPTSNCARPCNASAAAPA
jgi:L-lactate dehydrogenase complex protein LldF